jgi:hypothetical protein
MCFIFHDINRTALSGLTIAIAVNYDNCKIVNIARPWKYYRKMNRNIPSDAAVKLTNRGYITTSSPTSTQVFCLFLNAPVALASTALGYIMCTFYISAYGRQ